MSLAFSPIIHFHSSKFVLADAPWRYTSLREIKAASIGIKCFFSYFFFFFSLKILGIAL